MHVFTVFMLGIIVTLVVWFIRRTSPNGATTTNDPVDEFVRQRMQEHMEVFIASSRAGITEAAVLRESLYQIIGGELSAMDQRLVKSLSSDDAVRIRSVWFHKYRYNLKACHPIIFRNLIKDCAQLA